nr:OmpH family outer membrane protein [Pseudomaricurvus sp. HS19]
MFSTATLAASKVVVCDMQGAIMQTDRAKKAAAALEARADYATMKSQEERLRAELTNMNKLFDTKGMTWSPEKKAEQFKKAEYAKAELKLVSEKLAAEQREVIAAVMKELGPKAQEGLKELIAAEGIGMVLDGRGVIWASEPYNITAELTAKLNKMK